MTLHPPPGPYPCPIPPNRFWSLFRVVGAVSVAIAETLSGRTA